ncbi:MAG: DUF4167 domain-containing protein [PS1 clade bacterium]|uniref:DUF4167 domain-containing protein n=1 Tax=PS1 clade bacterium TaxID=2175152 RepID=A0A368DYQ8_9PROT|nr:MAG: DUF4167 domain-containing protein [PS1 clade bacterium]|tara:strand:- start:7643 stop:8230 length:588 start_codon:yes stop_codon:yes gene_type:complete
MKRSRGRGRRQGNSSNRNYESNGPNLKVRGNAQSIYEKYQSLAHDALSSGELITAENYLQHAEHYYRIVQANQPVRQEEDASSENGQQPTTQDTDTVEQLVLGAGEEGADTEAIAKANGAENGTNNGDAREEKQSRRRGPLRRRRRDDNGSNGTSEDAGNGEVTASVETSSEVDAIAPPATAPASESADDEAASA